MTTAASAGSNQLVDREVATGPPEDDRAPRFADELTVIVPAYNEATSIADTIKSLLEQTEPPAHIIVIDDCSTDGTGDVPSRLPNKSRTRTHERNWKVRFVPDAVCYPIVPHTWTFLSKQLRRWCHGFVQNVRLHWRGLLGLRYLRSTLAIASSRPRRSPVLSLPSETMSSSHRVDTWLDCSARLEPGKCPLVLVSAAIMLLLLAAGEARCT